MPIQPQTLPWTPAPPLAPLFDFIDDERLDDVTRGHDVLERIVLRTFAAQSRKLLARIDERLQDGAAHLTTLAVLARGVGAMQVADAADYARGALAECDGRNAALGTLRMALDAVIGDIDTRLRMR